MIKLINGIDVSDSSLLNLQELARLVVDAATVGAWRDPDLDFSVLPRQPVEGDISFAGLYNEWLRIGVSSKIAGRMTIVAAAESGLKGSAVNSASGALGLYQVLGRLRQFGSSSVKLSDHRKTLVALRDLYLLTKDNANASLKDLYSMNWQGRYVAGFPFQSDMFAGFIPEGYTSYTGEHAYTDGSSSWNDVRVLTTIALIRFARMIHAPVNWHVPMPNLIFDHNTRRTVKISAPIEKYDDSRHLVPGGPTAAVRPEGRVSLDDDISISVDLGHGLSMSTIQRIQSKDTWGAVGLTREFIMVDPNDVGAAETHAYLMALDDLVNNKEQVAVLRDFIRERSRRSKGDQEFRILNELVAQVRAGDEVPLFIKDQKAPQRTIVNPEYQALRISASGGLAISSWLATVSDDVIDGILPRLLTMYLYNTHYRTIASQLEYHDRSLISSIARESFYHTISYAAVPYPQSLLITPLPSIDKTRKSNLTRLPPTLLTQYLSQVTMFRTGHRGTTFV